MLSRPLTGPEDWGCCELPPARAVWVDKVAVSQRPSTISHPADLPRAPVFEVEDLSAADVALPEEAAVCVADLRAR